MLKAFKTIRSSFEPSANFLINFKNGVIETRYVRKNTRVYDDNVIPDNDSIPNHLTSHIIPDKSKTVGNNYVACYVSSHNGCKMGCKMCWLTHNNDTSMDHVDIPTYLHQVNTVLEHYMKVTNPLTTPSNELEPKALRCNVNFMSKGDAMANKYLVFKYPELYTGLSDLCKQYGLTMKPNISTIMPAVIKNHNLTEVFAGYPAYLYYSLYSINPRFRKIWLPNAMPYEQALEKLKYYQESQTPTNKTPITFHWALIKGENDSITETKELAKILGQFKFNGKVNIVRFNPHPDVSDLEADPERLNEIFEILAGVFNNPKSYIVPRLDVKTRTPCGMFVSREKELQQ